jgi:nucleotide-binding universal stress UspA family protein
MSMKSIVTTVTDVARERQSLQRAVDIARRFTAHLSVVFVKPVIDFPPGMIGRAASIAYLEDLAEETQRRADEAHRQANEVCGALPDWSWHEADADIETIASRFANLADLLIVPQHPPQEGDWREVITADDLVAAAGCPMLLLPVGWAEPSVGSRILVAWKNDREAIRAIRSGLTFMASAHEVWILADAEDTFADPPGSDIAAYLARHGIRAEIAGTADDGEAIIEVAQSRGADLVVMGAYGHFRPRKLLFGGATRRVLHETSIPVLMEH